MKKYRFFIAAIYLGLVNFQVTAQEQVEFSGEQTIGVRQVDLSTNSSKFNEYRDIRNGFYLKNLSFEASNIMNKWFVDFSSTNLLLDDQLIRAKVGDMGNRWNIIINNNRTPHRLSNKSATPYFYQGNGVFTSPDKVNIITEFFDTLGTPSLVPTAAQMAVNDSLIRAFLNNSLRQFNLDVQRDLTSASLSLPRLGAFSFGLVYSNESREGNRIMFGPIGDRPPRTHNIQLPEPIQYRTQEVSANLEFLTTNFQVQLNYLFSAFDSRIESMRWENIYFRPNAGADFLTTVPATPRNVSNFGQRALAPDNFYHNFSFTGGVNLPLASRLTANVAYGIMRQDEDLLPYSVSTLGSDRTPNLGDGLNWNNTAKLSRRNADAEITTLRIDVDYSVSLVRRLNLRPFFRYYNLDNKTPISNWRYVTQDAANTNGSVSILNFRRNLAYGFEKMRFGLDASYYFSFWRTSFMAGYTREGIDRDYREANTDEDIIEVSLRTRPINMLSVSVGFLYGKRKTDTYNYRVTSQSYWYTFEQGAEEGDNPQFLFADHPDLRRYDVSDRKRSEISAAITVNPINNLDLTASYRNRDFDFDSDVAPIAPFAGTLVHLPNPADINAMTPGQQLGLLKDNRQNFTVNIHYLISEGWNIFLFGDVENIDLDTRSIIYNEMLRREPSNAAAQNPTELGTWSDPKGLFNAKTEQVTNTIGAGTGFSIIPGKLNFSVDYSLSLTEEDLKYSGYGSDPAFLGRAWENFQFGFDDPETVKFDQYILNASIEYRVLASLNLGFHYMYSRYYIQDWVQEPDGPWVERVGSEYFLRDITRDNRWGNRLVNMGSNLAPSFNAHVGFISFTYRF